MINNSGYPSSTSHKQDNGVSSFWGQRWLINFLHLTYFLHSFTSDTLQTEYFIIIGQAKGWTIWMWCAFKSSPEKVKRI